MVPGVGGYHERMMECTKDILGVNMKKALEDIYIKEEQKYREARTAS